MKPIKINDSDINILKELLKSSTIEKKREAPKKEVDLIPEVFFGKVPKWLFMSKENFVTQYETWSESEKMQIDLLLSFMRLNSFVKGGVVQHHSKHGYYLDLWISDDNVNYPFRIHAERGFLDFITYYQLFHFKPEFTLAELHEAALKED